MVLAHSLLRGNVAEHVRLLLIGSSHAHWTRSALLRCKISDFFRSLLELDTSGKLLRSWGAGLFYNPHSIDVDKDGNVWLVDSGIKDGKGSQVYKYTPDGKLLMSLGKPGVSGNGPDEFNQPNAVKIGP